MFNKLAQILSHLSDTKRPTSIVVGDVKEAIGERPEITFDQLCRYYLEDPTIQNAVNSFRDHIVGSGFYVTASSERAVNIINEFCDGIDLDSILYDVVGEMLVCGNSFLEMLAPENLEDLERVQITTVKRVRRDAYGNPLSIIQEVNGAEHELDPRNFIHFKLFEVARQPFGIGLFHALALPQTVNGKRRPSVLDSWNKMRDAMVRIFENYSDPKVMYVFDNASESFLQDQAVKIRNMEKGEAFLTNKKFEFHELKVDPRTRFDGYVTAVRTEIELGSQTPAAKLQTTTGYTEASARAVIELVERRIIGIQRKLRRIIEREIFDRVLIKNGLNVQRARVELHWGQPDMPEFNIEDIFRAANTIVEGKPLITWQEARNILKKSGWELTSTESRLGTEISEMQVGEEVLDGLLENRRSLP
ncbi:MAG: hypothetical protein QXU32_06585 [Nitrososphaerales archaeon]